MNPSFKDAVLELPKIDLHRHLDGSIRTKTILDLAREQDVELPAGSVDELEQHVTVPPDCRSLSEFLDCFETFYPVIQTPDAVRRIARELREDLVDRNVIYAEVRFAPVLLTEASYSQETMVQAALDGIREGNRDDDITVNVILCLYRGTGLEASLETVNVARQYGPSGVVGVDLAGDESRYPAGKHREAFERAIDCGLGVTVHAGEAGPAENVREALELGADRIGHGVRAVEDESLLEELDDRNIPLEICVTSNLQTQAVASLDDHPVRSLYERGLRVTINTDDPSVSRTSIDREFLVLAREFNFTPDELRDLLKKAADAAFVNEERSEALKRTIMSGSEDDRDERG